MGVLGRMTMRKRTIILIVAVAAMLLTACGKKPEEKEKPKPYGFKEYSVDPKDSSRRTLTKEYENRVTERTWKNYDESGEVTWLKREYYDETGEHLLKEVTWGKERPTVSREYDFQGRCTVEMSKYEDGVYPVPNFDESKVISFPQEYWNYSEKDGLKLPFSLTEVNRSVLEVRTEFSYRGDTDEIERICTKNGDGKVIGLLERGEGDIVLQELLECDLLIYEETYDPQTRTAKWQVMESGELYRFGLKEFDAEGRCIRYTNSGTESWSDYSEYRFLYDETGYWQERYSGETESKKALDTRLHYNNAGERTVYEWYRSENRSMHVWYRWTTEYDEKERLLLSLSEEWDDDGDLISSERSEYEYEDSESESVERDYLTSWYASAPNEPSSRNLQYEKRTVTSEDPGLGTIKHVVTTWFVSGDRTQSTEIYAVCLPDPYDHEKENWVTYFCENNDTNWEAGEKTVTSELGENGRLLRVEDLSGSDATVYSEYNEQGLIIHRRQVSTMSDAELITEWEYWEE